LRERAALAKSSLWADTLVFISDAVVEAPFTPSTLPEDVSL